HESTLMRQIEEGQRIIANSQRAVEAANHDGSMAVHQTRFDALRRSLGDVPLTVENLFDREREWQRENSKAIGKLHAAIEPLREKVVEAMGRYLREFKEELDDLSPSVHALSSFLGV